ncbi:MAG: MerR family transcriptional regulator [Candidatus Sericytochromatia bacterium]
MSHTVKSAAAIAGVSVRTLHHYDHIGLLKPSSTTAAGYRLYTEADLERLQQILLYRAMGLSLAEIGAIVDDPAFDKKQALRQHREHLQAQQQQLDALIRSVDRSLEALERGDPTMDKTQFEGFDGFDDPYREEAEARWGKDRVAESYQRMGRFSKAEQQAWKVDFKRGLERLAELMPEGPDHPEVQSAMAESFRHINERYYDCSPEIFRNLGQMYVDDPRFTATYDTVKPGLAAFVRDAMAIHADRLEAKA